MEEKRITLQEMQCYVSNILRRFDEFCNEKELTYYVGYGTLLGAIRHNGFIPWDDDIDIMMPRDDYDKLLKYSFIDDEKRYEIVSSKNRRGWPYPFAKCVDNNTELIEQQFNSGTIGVYIDLFPLDGLPSGNIRRKIHMMYLYFWHYMLITLQKRELKGSSKLKTAVKYAVYPIAKLIGIERMVSHIEKIGRKYSLLDADFVASQMICVYGGKECVKRDFYKHRERHAFQDFTVWIPSGYDGILKSLYHDYMKLPPEDRRITHHIYNVKVKEQNIETVIKEEN